MFDHISVDIPAQPRSIGGTLATTTGCPTPSNLPLMSPGMLVDVPTPMCAEPKGAGGHGSGSEGTSPHSNGDAGAKFPRSVKTEDMVAMYEFKLKVCPNKDPHDWTLCMWAHEGEVARRRNPSCHSGNPCVEYEKTQTCPRGDRCPYAHGVWERGLHPQRYRTSLCSNVAAGGKCNRKICFFAHDPSEVRKSSSGFYYTADGWVEKPSTRSTRKKKSKRGGGKGSAGAGAGAGAGGVKNDAVGGVLPNGILSAESGEFESAIAAQSPEDTGDEGEETAVEGGRGWKDFMTESKAGAGKPLLAPMVHSVTWAMWAKTPIGAGASVGMWGSEGDAVSLGFEFAGSQAMESPEKGVASGDGGGRGSDGAVKAAAGEGLEGVDWIEELLEDGQRSGGTTPRDRGGASSLIHNDLKWGAFFMGVGHRGKLQGGGGGQGDQDHATVGSSGVDGISAAIGGESAGDDEQRGGTLRNMFADFEQSQAAHGGWFMRKWNNNNEEEEEEEDGGGLGGLITSIGGVLSVAPPEGPGATSGENAAATAAEKNGT